MKPRIAILLLFIQGVIQSCSNNIEPNKEEHKLKTVSAKGSIFQIPDSVGNQFTVIDEKSLTIREVKQPLTIRLKSGIVPAGNPEKIIVTGLKTFTPGKDTLEQPFKVNITDSSFLSPPPEIFTAKDAYSKELNAQNFSIYKKLQGLKHSYVNSLYEDKIGNIWFGTLGGGLAKFDGRNFTYYSTGEGLSNNSILSILEDKKGDFWFGTDGDGITKFDGKYFTHLSDNRGKSVSAIIEDKKGNIWIARNDGLIKFDGKEYIQYTTKQGLCDNNVLSLCADKKGNIWIGTSHGVAMFDGTSFNHFSEKDGLGNKSVKTITEDDQGNIWIGTMGGGAIRFNGKYLEIFTEKTGLSNNTVRVIKSDKNGNIWFGTWGGITKYDGKNFTIYTEEQGLSNNIVIGILNDRFGNLWFGTLGGGVNKYYGNVFTHLTAKDGLLHNDIRFIFEDSNKNIWLGSWGGLTKFDGTHFTNYTDKEGLSNNAVWNILEDKQGNIWFGTLGGGVNKFDGKRFTNITTNEGLLSNSILSLTEDIYGNIWIGTWGGGLYKYDGNRVDMTMEGKSDGGPTKEKLRKINGKFVKTLSKYTKESGLGSNIISSIKCDKDGILWIGTEGAGLVKFDGRTFTRYGKSEGLPSNFVTGVYLDRDQNIWFGNDGNGICRFDRKNTFTFLTEKEGLCNNSATNTIEDNSGNFWFSTRAGLSMITKEKLNIVLKDGPVNGINEANAYFKNYTYEDGFLGIGCNGNALCQVSNGDIWVGANDRLTIYDHTANTIDTIPPEVKLTGIQLFHEKIDWDKLNSKKDSAFVLGNGVKVQGLNFSKTTNWYHIPEDLSLAYNNNFLTFHFIGITHDQPKKVRYRYRLEGLEENWSAIGYRPEAHYGNLAPGSYEFKVKAVNSGGKWSNEFCYAFVIRPPWWKTLLFRITAFFLLIAAIWTYIRWREKTLRERQRELERTVAERTEEVVKEKKTVEAQKQLIEEKHKEITDSINYAERIQRNFLATKELLDKNLNDYFILFKPKDILSGDFYWASLLNNGNFAFVTADSTGHGVPGAIISLLNVTAIEKAIETHNLPNDILNVTRKIIIERLKRDGKEEGGKDGMDCSICVYDFENLKLFIASAHNPVWIIRDKELIEIKGDKMPVGKHDRDTLPFKLNEIQLLKGDIVYTLTDGFADQFGGDKGKKFMSKNLRALLMTIAHLPMDEQKNHLEKTLNDWKQNFEQVDDITVAGIRI